MRKHLTAPKKILTLGKETIRQLRERDLQAAVGGETGFLSCLHPNPTGFLSCIDP
jgi:hypothetical protein